LTATLADAAKAFNGAADGETLGNALLLQILVMPQALKAVIP